MGVRQDGRRGGRRPGGRARQGGREPGAAHEHAGAVHGGVVRGGVWERALARGLRGDSRESLWRSGDRRDAATAGEGFDGVREARHAPPETHGRGGRRGARARAALRGVAQPPGCRQPRVVVFKAGV